MPVGPLRSGAETELTAGMLALSEAEGMVLSELLQSSTCGVVKVNLSRCNRPTAWLKAVSEGIGAGTVPLVELLADQLQHETEGVSVAKRLQPLLHAACSSLCLAHVDLRAQRGGPSSTSL
eukprot:CAMPEP_0119321750 /NCGR_PEP_ID=MMETSP1333-20130426/56336_1 /TAXON_ID=418940 /ORGANISM="Scyphosphaera apsteinii, Strain RCC1455" /LENGTH=120 /DNA_ID=CAMNT_0007328795 /DNA_START=9 /DNA_END=368 /DNA_ORIENTATION=-